MVQPLPHGYTHDTRSDGAVVIKRYQGAYAEARRSAERLALTRMAGGVVLLPALIAEPPGALCMQHISGVHGQELIRAGYAAAVLGSCGQALRQIQAVEVSSVFEDVPSSSPAVVVHGDYGPNNMLFDPVTFGVAAILDWEWVHAGDPVEDLAWCEWIIRMHHPDVVGELDSLFAGYGQRPNWGRRQAAMLAKCQSMLALPRLGGTAAPGARRWHQNIEITGAWAE